MGKYAIGHKAMFNSSWNGLPDEEYLNTLSPELGNLRSRLFDTAYTAENLAGYLSKTWTECLLWIKKIITNQTGELSCRTFQKYGSALLL